MRPPAIVCVFVLYTKIFFWDTTREKTHFDFSWYIEMTDKDVPPPLEEVDEPSIEDEQSETSELEDELITDDLELSDEEDEDEDEDDDEDLEMNPFMDMNVLLTSVLSNEEGDTVCSALTNISRQLEVQNKILIKMLSQMQKKA